MLALSVQGNAPGAVPREAIVAVYGRMIDRGHPLAGFAAADLASWEQWQVTAGYRRILDSGVPLHPGARLAITGFLQRSPLATANW
jgi:hypothetical protein